MSNARAGPREDSQESAAAIQQRLDAGDPKSGEVLARAARDKAEAALGPDALETADLDRLLGDTLYDQRRYGEAEPFFRKALAIREALLAPESLDVAHSATDLGLTLKELGRYAEAEPHYLRALAIREKVLGPDHLDVARSLARLSRLHGASGDDAKAAPMLARAVSIGEKTLGERHETVILWTAEWAQTLHDSGDLATAEPVYRRAIAAAESVFPADDPDLANFRQGLANLLRQTGRPAEAEPLYRLALPVWEARLGADHPKVAAAWEGLGAALAMLGRPRDALEAYHGAFAIRDKAEGPEGERAAGVARLIAGLAITLDRNAEAEVFQKRALSVSEKHPGQGAQVLAYDLLALGALYASQRRSAEAEPLLTRAIELYEKADPSGESAVEARSALALVKLANGDSQGASELLERSIAALASAPRPAGGKRAALSLSLARIRLGQGDLAEAARLREEALASLPEAAADRAQALAADRLLGDIYLLQGRTADAFSLFSDVLTRVREESGDSSPTIRSAMADVARAHFAAGRFGEAVDLLEESVAITERLAQIDAAGALSERTGDVEDSAVARAGEFDFLVKAYDRLARQDPGRSAIIAAKAFRIAQRVTESQAATAVVQMAARQASGTGELAGLVRERQDLVAAWRLDDRKRSALRADPAAAADLAVIETRLGSVDSRIRAIDGRLARDFPDFAAFQKPSLLDFDAVRSKLRDEQVLLFFADTSRRDAADFETYLWVVPKKGEPRWIRLEKGTAALSGDVRKLRDMMGVGPQARGARSLVADDEPDRAGAIINAAAALYDETLRPVADMLQGKSLVIVPSKKLSGLPFHLLVSSPPDGTAPDRFLAARWLARDHAITVLPSVSALAAPARIPALDGQREAYMGFADPLLTGHSGKDLRAFSRQSCAMAPKGGQTVAEAGMPPIAGLMRGATADADAVRRLPPLPETTDEVCAVARALGADERALRLGAAATETEVKALSEDRRLSRLKILHFATHGLVSGDLSSVAEPALVLTPPETETALDDGLLTASEVATLKLDADWVILSACNTAAGDGGGESLSGLARAFFYAGARALMVSHWPVNSDAATRLATGAIAAIASEPAIAPAEALRRAMLDEIDKGGSHADPANWAPFIVVGTAG